jgi:hypothetical protein
MASVGYQRLNNMTDSPFSVILRKFYASNALTIKIIITFAPAKNQEVVENKRNKKI